MSKQNINIERLQIRFKGVSPQLARNATNDLGHELLGQLSSSGPLPANTGPEELRRRIAQSVETSIKSKLKRRE